MEGILRERDHRIYSTFSRLGVDRSAGKLVSRPGFSSWAVLDQVRAAARPLWLILVKTRDYWQLLIYWFARLASNHEVALFIGRSMLVIVLEVGRARRKAGS